jgi:hypothetical protein
MKKYLLFTACLLALLSCALLPRRETAAYPGPGGPGPAPAAVYIDKVDVDRRVLSREVARDVAALIPVLAPGHGLHISDLAGESLQPMRVYVVERETIRDFTQQFAIMVSLEIYSSREAPQPALTVVHTCESADSVSSPWTLKKILNDCLEVAARAFASGHGE